MISRLQLEPEFGLTAALITLLALSGCATSGVEPFRDISCFERAKVPLIDAINTAERSQGQKVIDAEYNCAAELACLTGNPGQYRITLFADDRLHRIGICPETGNVQAPVEKNVFERLIDLDFLFEWPESEMLKGGPTATAAPITMQAAIGIAEARGGKAMASHVKTERGKTRYVIEIVDRGRLQLVSVNLQNGTVIE